MAHVSLIERTGGLHACDHRAVDKTQLHIEYLSDRIKELKGKFDTRTAELRKQSAALAEQAHKITDRDDYIKKGVAELEGKTDEHMKRASELGEREGAESSADTARPKEDAADFDKETARLQDEATKLKEEIAVAGEERVEFEKRTAKLQKQVDELVKQLSEFNQWQGKIKAMLISSPLCLQLGLFTEQDRLDSESA